MGMTTASYHKIELPHHPSRRIRRRLASSGTEAEALRAFSKGMDEIARQQPFALYMLEGGRYEVVLTSDGGRFRAFDGTCSLARYLHAHPHPVMAFGTRRARCMGRQLDPEDSGRLAHAGAVAVVPVLDEGRPVGFAVLGKQPEAVGGGAADPMAVSELTERFAVRLSELRREESAGAKSALRGHPHTVRWPLGIAG